MSHRVTVQPAAEPVSRTEAKNYLKVDDTTDDDLIDALITSARQYIEEYCQIKLINTTILEKQNQFPKGTDTNPRLEILLSIGNVTSISSVKYYDTSDSLETWSSDNYILDNALMLSKIGLSKDASYPSTRNTINAVEITYISGFGATAADVPKPLHVAMLMLIADYYENRYNRNYQSNNTAVKALIDRYKAYL